MIKILLVDDELIVTEGLKKMIKWEEMGFELVDIAINGLEGVEKIERHKADVVITDIRMPGIDGLKMIEQLQTKGCKALFIVMSAYAEFEYAKKALKLGVIDYLEKPITISNVVSVLEKVKSFYYEQLKEKQLSAQATLQKELLELIYEEDDEMICNKINKIKHFSEVKESYFYCVFKGKGKNTEKKFRDYLDVLLDKIPITYEMVKEGENFLGVIFIKTNNYKKANIYSILDKALKKTLKSQGTIHIGVSGIVDCLEELRRACLEAGSALKHSEFMGEKKISLYEDLRAKLPVIQHELFDESILWRNMRSNNGRQVEKQIKQYLRILKSNNVDPRLFNEEALKLVYRGAEIIREKDKGFIMKSDNGMLPHEELQTCLDYNEVENWILNLFEQMLRHLNEEERSTHQKFDKAREYLEQNFNQEISLQDLADIAGMNTTYFSQLFKEKMGTSYIKYLTTLRLEYAKKLLNEGYKITEVSEKVGYVNTKYFSDIFKKHMHMTPTAFKNKINY